MSDLKFNIIADSANATKTVVKARNFEIIVDEPPVLGGKDEGPNPVEFVLAAYAGCINVVGHVVAKEMGFRLDGVKIEISGSINPENFLGKSNKERAGYKQIEMKVIPNTTASEEVLAEWLEKVCNRCPVSDNIKHETPVSIQMN